MQKTLFVGHWPGGGVWGLQQLVFAKHMEKISDQPIAELIDANISASIGSVAANALLIPDDVDPTKPKFKAEELIAPFKICASEIFHEGGAHVQHFRGFMHDVHHLLKARGPMLKRVARFFPNKTGQLHLNHSILGKFIENCVGDLKMSSLLKSSCVTSHRMNTMSAVCFAHIKEDMFDKNAWGIIDSLGDDHTIKDVIMAATAAPTIFGSHHINGDDFIDFANLHGPSDLSLVLETMATERIRQSPNLSPIFQNRAEAHVLHFGCGDTTQVKWDIADYNNKGPLLMMSELIRGMSLDVINRDHRRMDYQSARSKITMFDSQPFSINPNDKNAPTHDYFNGLPQNLDNIESFAEKAARNQYEKMARTIETIIETRARESRVDALAAFNIQTNPQIAVDENVIPEAAVIAQKPFFRFPRVFSRFVI